LISQEQASNDQTGYQSCATMHEAIFRLGYFIWDHAGHDNIVAFGTVMIALFTYVLYRSTHKLWDSHERQLGHLERTAKRELRAYIVTEVTDLIWPNNWQGIASVRIAIKNTGQTPAHDLRTVSRTALYDYPFPPDFDFTLISGEDPSVGLLGPGQPTETEGNSDPLSGDDWIVIRHGDGKQRLCTYGTVTYRDAFGDSQWTNFCVSHVFEVTPLPGGEKIAVASRTAERHNDAS